MSTAVYVYSVSPERLRAIAGSKDRELLALANEPGLKGFFRTIDEIAGDLDEDEERPPACAEAYRQIIDGEEYHEDFGYLYGYAYEALCQAIGAETERSWTSIAGAYDWFEEIDHALAEMGISLKVSNLLYRGALIQIPEPADYPGLGYWTADEIAAAATAFAKGGAKPSDGAIAEALEDIRSWVQAASQRPGDWLVGVHS